jgi:hypothetical protein
MPEECLLPATRVGYNADVTRVYEEIVDFIAAGTSPRAVAAFQPSDLVRERVRELLRLDKESRLTRDQALELEHYTQLEHIMRLAKARARSHLGT